MAAGRPSDYKEEYAEQARKLCLLGSIDEELADFFECSVSTLNNWKQAHPEFMESIKQGKQIADANVVDRLYKKAMGYSCPETKIVSYEGQVTDQVDIVKHYPPDATAAIFLLKNRQPKKWRDRQEIDNTSSDGSMATYSPEDYAKAQCALKGKYKDMD